MHGDIDGIGVHIRNISHAGLEVEITDEPPALARWSLGQKCVLNLKNADADDAGLDLEIARIDPDQARLAGTFSTISDRQYALIEQLVLRGRLVNRR